MRNNQTKTTLSNFTSVNKRKNKEIAREACHPLAIYTFRDDGDLAANVDCTNAIQSKCTWCNEGIYKITSTNLIYFI